MNYKLFVSFTVFLFSVQFAMAQDLSSDELFKQARNAAFEEKNYSKAITLSRKALVKSPNYADIKIFLGRLYTWSKKTDSASIIFNEVLKKQPDNEDAALAYGSLAYWNDREQEALGYINNGLKYHPNSENLLLLKAKILNSLKQWAEAETVINQILNKNTEARALASRIRDNSAINKIGLSYSYVYFDKQFDNPWHLTSIDYSRQTKIGSFIGRINYANRFNSNGLQFEVDAYPRLGKNLQAYISGGYSKNVGVFPKYRAGLSLYASLPLSFEGELGVRYLTFGEDTWIYTASVGKYYKNYWFNLRTYLSSSFKKLSKSFSLTTRYYYGGSDDYWSLRIGTGLSPDNPQNNVLIGNNDFKLISNNINVGYRKSFKSFNILLLNLGLNHQEYRLNTKGNQIDFEVGYMRRF